MTTDTDRLETARLLERDDARFLRVLWCDNANVIRAKSLHLPSARRQGGGRALLQHLERSLTISQALQALPVMADAPVAEAGLPPAREIRLVPDWGTLRALPHAPGHFEAMADLRLDQQPWALCPRDMLRRMEGRARTAGVDLQVGVELEFFVLHDSGAAEAAPVPVDRDVYAALSAQTARRALIDDIADTLWSSGIALCAYNPESGPGQHEISLAHTSPLALADAWVAARGIMRAVAERHQCLISFLPKLFADATGSGAHLHMSLWADGRNVTPAAGAPHGLDPRAHGFIAGILAHLPALTALTTPTPNSFRRLQPQSWSGAFTAWGFDNKEAAIRVLAHPASPGPERFELKTVDLSANPYLALGAVLAAGLDGMTAGRTLGEPVAIDPAALDETERRRIGVERLPRDLGDALQRFAGDSVLRGAMGEAFAAVYEAVRRAELAALGSASLESERALLLTRY